MPFYRYGKPGEDTWAHLNFGRKGGPAKCVMPRLEKDDASIGEMCGRMSVALCDSPKCDQPICELHRTKHPEKSNVDFCPEHKGTVCIERGHHEDEELIDPQSGGFTRCKICGRDVDREESEEW